jgi:hypothetical protein
MTLPRKMGGRFLLKAPAALKGTISSVIVSEKSSDTRGRPIPRKRETPSHWEKVNNPERGGGGVYRVSVKLENLQNQRHIRKGCRL